MSELPDLPPVVRRSRPLPPGGIEAAMASGARKRNRVLAMAGGTTTALVAALALTVSLPDGGSDSLGIAERPDPGPSVTAPAVEVPQEEAEVPAEAPPVEVPTTAPDPALPAPPGEGAGSSSTPPRTTTGPRPAGQGAQPGPAAEPAQPPAAAPAPVESRPAYREDTDEDAPSGTCPAPAIGGCTYTGSNGGIVRRGMQAQVFVGSCNGRDSVGDHVYFFDGGQEKEVVVTDSRGAEVFRFSSTVRYVEGPHERRLRVGRCIRWTGRWDLVDTAGRPVPAGEYRMTLTVRADRHVYENAPPAPSDGQPYVQETWGSVTVLD